MLQSKCFSWQTFSIEIVKKTFSNIIQLIWVVQMKHDKMNRNLKFCFSLYLPKRLALFAYFVFKWNYQNCPNFMTFYSRIFHELNFSTVIVRLLDLQHHIKWFVYGENSSSYMKKNWVRNWHFWWMHIDIISNTYIVGDVSFHRKVTYIFQKQDYKLTNLFCRNRDAT